MAIQKVDLVLGMPQPTGALRIVWLHSASSRRWTTTTLAALLYLTVNIVGRLSVASLGLAFDINEGVEIEYPVMVTNWSSNDWFGLRRENIQNDRTDWSYTPFHDTMSKNHWLSISLGCI
jgi:hypothetical protein